MTSDCVPVLAQPSRTSVEELATLLETKEHEKAWALKRDWTDVEFQEGAEANRERLQGFEDMLIQQLRESAAVTMSAEIMSDVIDVDASDVLMRVLNPLTACSGSPPEDVRLKVLNDPKVLGSALDLVGAYLKNYEVDKAASVLETVLPICRARGGLWLLKTLNHLSTVRMKQARPSDALVILREVEAITSAVQSSEDREEAWMFWETVYRNFGWIFSSLGQEDEAIKYIQRAIDTKERVGLPASWFDLWDLGRMKAGAALKKDESKSIEESQALITKALWLHRDAEQKDLVMRAKIWHSVGECSFALGHLEEQRTERLTGKPTSPNGLAIGTESMKHYRKALKCMKESHKLFRKTEGQYNPLTGAEAAAVAWAMLKVGSREEAKEFLLDSLEALSRQQSGWGDGCLDAKAPALTHASLAVDRVLEIHRETNDRGGLVSYFSALERLCANVSGRLQITKGAADAAVYEKLVSSCSIIMIASGTAEGTTRSSELLRKYLWDKPNTMQAQLCSSLLRSLPSMGQTG